MNGIDIHSIDRAHCLMDLSHIKKSRDTNAEHWLKWKINEKKEKNVEETEYTTHTIHAYAYKESFY